jgi:tetratricopeptide (TPR) repeat protein
MELSIVKAQVLRSMGLPERVISLLEEGLGSITDPNQKAQACFQLAQCHQDLGQWEPARRYLSQVLEVGEPGPLTQQAGLELASVSLRLGQPEKTIAFCRQVLDANPPEPVRQRASDLMATAYADRQDYDKAAESLLPGPADHKRLPVRPTNEAQGPSREVTHAEG